MTSKRHRHQFHLLTFRFGPVRKDDVHYHPCWDHECSRVLIGLSRWCIQKKFEHQRETL